VTHDHHQGSLKVDQGIDETGPGKSVNGIACQTDDKEITKTLIEYHLLYMKEGRI